LRIFPEDNESLLELSTGELPVDEVPPGGDVGTAVVALINVVGVL